MGVTTLPTTSRRRSRRSRGAGAAIAVADQDTEKLVAIIEFKPRAMDKLGVAKREVNEAISNSHGLAVADLVLVEPGSIPIRPYTAARAFCDCVAMLTVWPSRLAVVPRTTVKTRSPLWSASNSRLSNGTAQPSEATKPFGSRCRRQAASRGRQWGLCRP